MLESFSPFQKDVEGYYVAKDYDLFMATDLLALVKAEGFEDNGRLVAVMAGHIVN